MPKVIILIVCAYIMTGSQKPEKRSKAALEQLVKINGGNIVQNEAREGTICVGGNSTISYLWCIEVVLTRLRYCACGIPSEA